MFGLDVPLHHLVNALKSAAAGYGIERRVLLLHGPGRQQQKHDRAAAEEGDGAIFGDR